MKTKKLLFSFILFGSLLTSCNLSLPSSEASGSQGSEETETSAVSEQTSGEASGETSVDPNLDTYFVSFWTDVNASDPYAEYELAIGTPITFPAPPTHATFTFDGWYLEGAKTPFVELTPITDDVDLYAKWKGDTVTDGKYQIVGELENSNLSEVSWDTTSAQSFFEIAGPGEYYLEIELGYGAEFKVRETATGWDGFVLGYDNINENDRTNHFSSGGDHGNVKIESAGTYYIELIPSEDYLFIEIVDSNVSAGVTVEQVPVVTALRLIGDLAVSGSLVSWDITPFDESSLLTTADNVTFSIEIAINEGGAFKIKEPGSGWNEGLELNYGNIWHSNRRAFTSRGENNNVLINEDGVYVIEVSVNRAVPKLVITKI